MHVSHEAYRTDSDVVEGLVAVASHRESCFFNDAMPSSTLPKFMRKPQSREKKKISPSSIPLSTIGRP
jgi:hypothetical protein